MTRRKAVGITIGLAAFASVPALAAVYAQDGSGEGDFKVSKSAFAYTSATTSTSSTEFHPVPGLDDLEILGRDAATASFSGDLSGGPVEVRVVQSGGGALQPGTARFAPDGNGTSFSHDFVMPNGRGVACRTLVVEWRSSTGAQVTLNHGSLIADYRFDDTTKKGLRVSCPD